MNGQRRDVDGMLAEFSDEQVRRLLAFVHPTRIEQTLSRIVTRAYGLSENGPVGWVGDRADDLRCRLQWRRARNGRHLIAKGRRR